MSTTPDPQRLVLRTTWPLAHLLGPKIELRYGVPSIAAAVTFLGVLIWILEADGVGPSPGYWAILSIPVAAIVYALYLTRQYDGTVLVIWNGTLALEKWFAPRREVVITEITRVVLCGVQLEFSGIPQPAAFMLNRDGRCLMSLFVRRWSQDDLRTLWDHLALTPEGSFDNEILNIDLDTLMPHAFDKAA